MTADDIRKQVKAALREFGRYAFADKGANEVMDTKPILDYVKALPAGEARALLLDVATSKEEMCRRLVEDLVCDLDGQPDEWWNELMSDPRMADMY